ncbi:hypothetical protein Bca52824_063302 [Brassica carinata]|uniref:Uncharacterized protein n=1 Tax=Brassica carinata TaxID=52824 RepID=A0A8X7QEI6_BRACI|nr:hypothetical protein Bca52824_063302 [Brassica carinata]
MSQAAIASENNVSFIVSLISRHRALVNVFDKAPILDKEAFVTVILEEDHLFWYGFVQRGDVNTDSVGSGTNIQDNSLVHVAKSYLFGKVPPYHHHRGQCNHWLVIVLCYMDVLLRMRLLSRMGATLDGVVVEKHDMVAAGACLFDKTLEFLPSGEKIWEETQQSSSGSLRKLTFFPKSAENYSNLAKAHAAENAKPLNAIEFEKGRKDEEYDAMLGIVRETPPELKLSTA